MPWQTYVLRMVNRGFPLETIVYLLELKYPCNFMIENEAIKIDHRTKVGW